MWLPTSKGNSTRGSAPPGIAFWERISAAS
ncbi:UNVERIFIED_CONTAM: hypothetical protein GTU68_026382 [Idotea baltica]|nr:hypothetical protein [Idotea baltica]